MNVMPERLLSAISGILTSNTGNRVTVPHTIGVTGQHEVLMVGLYTCDPAKVVSKSRSLYWHTTVKVEVRSRLE